MNIAENLIELFIAYNHNTSVPNLGRIILSRRLTRLHPLPYRETASIIIL